MVQRIIRESADVVIGRELQALDAAEAVVERVSALGAPNWPSSTRWIARS